MCGVVIEAILALSLAALCGAGSEPMGPSGVHPCGVNIGRPMCCKFGVVFALAYRASYDPRFRGVFKC